MKKKNGEHPLGDSGQLVLLVLFLLIWVVDSFFLRISTFLSDFISLVFFCPLLTYADECTEGNCTNGHGTMIYADGTKRVGGFKNF